MLFKIKIDELSSRKNEDDISIIIHGTHQEKKIVLEIPSNEGFVGGSTYCPAYISPLNNLVNAIHSVGYKLYIDIEKQSCWSEPSLLNHTIWVQSVQGKQNELFFERLIKIETDTGIYNCTNDLRTTMTYVLREVSNRMSNILIH